MGKVNLETKYSENPASESGQFKGNKNEEEDSKPEVRIILERCNASGKCSRIMPHKKLFQQKTKCANKETNPTVTALEIENVEKNGALNKHKENSSSKRKSKIAACSVPGSSKRICNEAYAMLDNSKKGLGKSLLLKHKKGVGCNAKYFPLRKHKQLPSERENLRHDNDVHFSLQELILKEKCELANNPKVIDFLRTNHEDPFVDVQDADEKVNSWGDIYFLCSATKQTDGDLYNLFEKGDDAPKSEKLDLKTDVSFGMKIKSPAESDEEEEEIENVPIVNLEKGAIRERRINNNKELNEKIDLDSSNDRSVCSEIFEEKNVKSDVVEAEVTKTSLGESPPPNVSLMSDAFSEMNVKMDADSSLNPLAEEAVSSGDHDFTEEVQCPSLLNQTKEPDILSIYTISGQTENANDGPLPSSLFDLIVKFASIMNISQSNNLYSSDLLLYGKSNQNISNCRDICTEEMLEEGAIEPNVCNKPSEENASQMENGERGKSDTQDNEENFISVKANFSTAEHHKDDDMFSRLVMTGQQQEEHTLDYEPEEDDCLSKYAELSVENEKPSHNSSVLKEGDNSTEMENHATEESVNRRKLLKISAFFKNVCFQYLKKKTCTKKHCMFVHEMPDILQLNGEFEEEIEYAKQHDLIYFLNKTYEVLIKDTCKNQSEGMWEKVMSISEMCGFSHEQFTRQMSNYIGKCFYINSISIYELLLVLLKKSLLECSWNVIRVLPDLDHDVFPEELIGKFIDIINTKTCNEAICRKLYHNMFVHVPALSFKKIEAFEVETFASNLEHFGLHEEAQFFRSKFVNLNDRSKRNVLQPIPDALKTATPFKLSTAVNLDKESKSKNTTFQDIWCKKLENFPEVENKHCSILKRLSSCKSSLYPSPRDAAGKFQNICENNYRSILRMPAVSKKMSDTSEIFEETYNDMSQELASSGLGNGHRSLLRKTAFDAPTSSNEVIRKTDDVDDDSGLGESADAYQGDQHSLHKSQKRKDDFVKKRFKKPRSVASKNVASPKEEHVRINRTTLDKQKWERINKSMKISFHENPKKYRTSTCNSEMVTGCLKPWSFASRTYKVRRHVMGPMPMSRGPFNKSPQTMSTPGPRLEDPRKFVVLNNLHHPFYTQGTINCHLSESVNSLQGLEEKNRANNDESFCDRIFIEEMPRHHSSHFHAADSTLQDRSMNMVLRIFKTVKENKGSFASAWQVYCILKLDLQTSVNVFSYLVQDTAQYGLRPPLNIEKFLSTVGTNLMVDQMVLCHWNRAYEVFSIMRTGLIDIRLSEIYREEIFSPCRKILCCVEVCLQIGATEEGLNILKYNRMLTPDSLIWKPSSIQEDLKQWMKLCTILLHQFVLEGPMVLAQWLFLELLKAQGNLFQGVELSALSNLLMVKLLNEDYTEEAVQLYHHIKPYFEVLASHTYRALLVTLIFNNHMEMSRSVFESCILLNIYPRMKMMDHSFIIKIYCHLLQEEIYMMLTLFLPRALKHMSWNGHVTENANMYKIVIWIEPREERPKQSAKDVLPKLLMVECSLNATQQRIFAVLHRKFCTIKAHEDSECPNMIMLDPSSVIKHFEEEVMF